MLHLSNLLLIKNASGVGNKTQSRHICNAIPLAHFYPKVCMRKFDSQCILQFFYSSRQRIWERMRSGSHPGSGLFLQGRPLLIRCRADPDGKGRQGQDRPLLPHGTVPGLVTNSILFC